MSLRSPAFTRNINAGLAAGAIDFHNYETDTLTGGSAPFNSMMLQNFSGQLLSASYGDKSDIIISPYSIFIDEEAYGLRSLSIKNIDTAPTDKLIQVIVQKTISARDANLANALKIPVEIISKGEW